MMDTVDKDNVKWIMVLLYALSDIILFEGTIEPTRAIHMENLLAECLFLCKQNDLELNSSVY